MSLLDLRPYFTPQAVVQRLKSLPPLQSAVVDRVFKRKINHPLALVGRQDITDLALPAPLILRGGPSLPTGGGPVSLAAYEPYEVAQHDRLDAADLNNLQVLGAESIEARLAGIDDRLRRICRATTEGLAATALTGTVRWPVAVEGGGYETYTVQFGETLAYTPDVLWSAAEATLRKVYFHLQDMETLVTEAGYGGKVTFWAGKFAFVALLALADVYTEDKRAKLKVEVGEGYVIVGGYKIEKMVERYRNPETGAMTAKVDDHKIMAWAEDAVHTLFYCALDDLDAKLRPLPYYSKPIRQDDPSGVKIVGRSKPFPVPVPQAICWATVTAQQEG